MPSARRIRAQHVHDQARSQTTRPRLALLHPARNRCRTPSHTPRRNLARARPRPRAQKSDTVMCELPRTVPITHGKERYTMKKRKPGGQKSRLRVDPFTLTRLLCEQNTTLSAVQQP